MKKEFHVIPAGTGWAIKKAGNKKSTSVHDTKIEALKAAVGLAKKENAELVIHDKKGKIRDKDSYGNDPCPPKDKVH